MGTVTLIIAIVALIIAIVAYYRTGGVAALKKQVENLTNAGETMVSKASDSLRENQISNILDFASTSQSSSY